MYIWHTRSPANGSIVCDLSTRKQRRDYDISHTSVSSGISRHWHEGRTRLVARDVVAAVVDVASIGQRRHRDRHPAVTTLFRLYTRFSKQSDRRDQRGNVETTRGTKTSGIMITARTKDRTKPGSWIQAGIVIKLTVEKARSPMTIVFDRA